MEVKCYFGTISLNIHNSDEGRRSVLEMPACLLLPRIYFKVRILEMLFSMFPMS